MSQTGRSHKDSRRGVAVVASILVHGAVLAVLAISAAPALKVVAPARAPPDVMLYLQPLEPRLHGEGASGAAAAAKAAASTRATSAVVDPRPAVAPPPPQSVATPSPPVAAPAPAAPSSPTVAAQGGAPGPSASPGDGHDWRVRPGASDLQGRLHGLVACGSAQYQKLTPAEQLACDRTFAGGLGTDMPHVDRIPAEKRAYYDAVAAAYAKVRSPAGASAPGFGCMIRFGIPRGWKSYHDRPPHSLKLGSLPCFITPPQTLGTEESGVQGPASLRERTDDAAHLKQLEAPPKP